MAADLFELNQLRYFVAVAEELNFRRAAKRLNMTQPPLSRHINLLEHAVGVKLFDRTSRSVRLTLAGERFLYDAVDILQRAESAMLPARQAERGESGTVALGFVPSAAIEVVPRVLRHLAEAPRGVSITPREMMSVEQVEWLLAGSLDLGLTRLPRSADSLGLTRVCSEPLMAAVPKHHPLARREVIRAEDLNGQPMIGYSTDRGGILYETVTGFFNSVGVSPNVRYAVSQGHTVMGLVDAGPGIGLVPRSARHICMEHTVMREFEQPETIHSDLHMAIGPRGANPLVARVARRIEAELARG